MIHIDFETYSSADLEEVGEYRGAVHCRGIARGVHYPLSIFTVKKGKIHYKNVYKGRFVDADTWGGKLLENFAQATAFYLIANGMLEAEKAGYVITNTIHDQALAEVQPGQTSLGFASLLTRLPAWAKDFPLAAEHGVIPYYC
jgi:hypothetical protein